MYITHTIHVTGVFTYMDGWGKYTSPMDGMGYIQPVLLKREEWTSKTHGEVMEQQVEGKPLSNVNQTLGWHFIILINS